MDREEATYLQRQSSCTYHYKIDIPYSISVFISIKHLFLSGVWLGVPKEQIP